ncbi:aldehyde dehydrogenase family 2 member C4-like [Gossypium australe]|uniref:Aldehyde dehydrogenase family 2 member C4-like n=1 Tax=Gossypium australe TaxID=47621 RepID=A0A5B6USA3_9ROSI|nr:aldehyde dehydrogenase family 2 member C4-like [Gossypium australe]
MIPNEENSVSTSEEGQDIVGGTMILQVQELSPLKEKPWQLSTHTKKKTARLESLVNKLVTENEAKEFLKFLKHSKTAAQTISSHISTSLFLSLETHHSALMKVGHGINEGSTYHYPLQRYTLPGVLIDNGSLLNVLPLSILNRLPVDSFYIKTCENIVRAFNSTEMRVMGMIEIPLLVGLNIYELDFLVMDIKPSYNCLLGRHWIHSTGAVPSSLHHKLKSVIEGRLRIIASVTSDTPYIEEDDEPIECSFRSLEFVNATFIVEGNKIPVQRISKTTKMGLQLTVGK